jgi:site-specific DNA recombinase
MTKNGSNHDASIDRAAVIYARVSSKDQEKEGFSIPSQLELLRGYSAAHAFTALQEFVDVETAKQAGRTGFGGMVALLRKTPGCRVVLVEKTDRLYRNFRDYVKGKCPERYTREEVLEEKFTGLLKGISFGEETLEWVRRALRDSHKDEKQFHDEAIVKLQREHRRLQDRIHAMYEDKLDGRIGNDFFDSKAAEMRTEQARIMRDLEAHQTANRSYMEEGVQLLELAHAAPALFESQPPAEKRKLLNFVLSNCTWKGGELVAKYRQPFDVLAVAVASEQQRIGGEMAETAKSEIWLPKNIGIKPSRRSPSY